MIACPKCGWELTPGAKACRRCGAVIPNAGAPPVSGAERAPLGSEPQLSGEDTARAQLQRAVASLYTVEGLLGRGPTTVVYKGAELNPPRPVAIKVLPPGLGTGPVAGRFKDEARKAMALNHPGIVPIYRVGLKGGTPYFVATKLVDGRSLDAIIGSHGALPIPVILAVLRDTAEALAYAHGRGSAHGHLKAANILVDRTGHVQVSDFGIARVIESAVPGAAGASRLEPAARGGEGPAGDQYALGIVALQMLKGAAPRDADPLVSLRSVVASRGALPAGLSRVIETVLAPDPTRRYAGAADLLAAIKAVPIGDDERREGAAALGQFASSDGEPTVRAPAAAALAGADVRATATVRPAAPAPRPAATPAPAAPKPAARPVRPAPPPPPPPPPPPEPEPETIELAEEPEPAPAAPARAGRPTSTPPAFEGRRPVEAQPPMAELELPPEPLRVDQEIAPPASPPPPPPRRTPAYSAAVPETDVPESRPSAPARPVMRRTRFTPSEHGLLATPPPRSGGSSLLVWVLVGLVIVAGGGAAYWFLLRRPAAQPVAAAPASSTATPASKAPGAPAAESARPDTARRAATPAPARADTGAPTGTGQLLVSAVPNTAEILVDGATSGSGGFLDSEVAVGRRHLQISAPGYETVDTVITVRAGGQVDLGQIALAPTGATAGPPRGWLWLRTLPASATIQVDGQLAGTGSLTQFEVTAGVRRLRIAAPGYVTLDTLVSVDAGAAVRLGQLTLRSAGTAR